MAEPRFRPLAAPPPPAPAELLARAEAFRDEVATRRTVRQFSPQPVDRAVITACLAAAASAPSGANLQPWQFVAVGDPALKRRIRQAAEEEERAFYAERAPAEWLAALAPLGTDADKPFLEAAPWLIAIFVQPWGRLPDGRRVKHYYATESVGIATGILITALHQAGLATLTHTPSPMGFLNQLLDRPAHERAFLLLVVGHPAADAQVPDIRRKPLDEVCSWLPAESDGVD